MQTSVLAGRAMYGGGREKKTKVTKRSQQAAQAAAAEATCHLLDLSHDEVSIVTHELCDPLAPLLAVHLSSTAKGLWVPMQEQLAELRQRHAEAAAMARAWGLSCAALADDSGLVVPALGGAPGLRSARYSGGGDDANNALLLRNMATLEAEDRAAFYVAVVVLLEHADDPTPLIAEGRWHGCIATAPQQ